MIELLKQTELFGRLPEEILQEVAAALVRRSLSTGEVLFHQGDPGDELILVERGQIAIYAPAPDDPAKGQPIRLFRDRQALGEMALIDQKPRSLSARAEEPTTILTLDGQAFRRLIQDHPELALSVMAGLSERIRYTTDFLNEVRLWVQRVASGSYQLENISEERYRDSTLSTLAAEFAQMASRVQEREEKLRQEVAMLRIQVDEEKRRQEVNLITSSEAFQSLKEKARQLRQRNRE